MEIPLTGERLSKRFQNERLLTNNTQFHKKLSRNTYTTFNSKDVKIKPSEKTSTRSLEVNRNVLGTLLGYSIKSGKKVDFEKALKYPLSPIPLSIANGDGTKRKTNKSKLTKILLRNFNEASIPEKKSNSAYVTDLMAVIRTLKNIPNTFEELTWRILKTIPRNHTRVDIIADTYRTTSIKMGERDRRGESSKIVVQSKKSRIPRDFSKFLSNGENKRRMIELVFETIIHEKLDVLGMLGCTEVYLSGEEICTKVTTTSAAEFVQLSSNQEEADTKVILHTSHILRECPSLRIVL